jgi:proteasome lid subunit RPN8/RPN11
MVRTLIISNAQWEAMRHHVAAIEPLEACGLLAGRGGEVQTVLTVPNALKSPSRFRMEPQEQLKAFNQIESAGMEVIAIFHSHPNGPDHPSLADIEESAYPVVNLIWAPRDGDWQARGFWIEAGSFSEVTLRVADDE